jgi:predicted AlkP superfamily pyrophosphatase or phosphodiesterase
MRKVLSFILLATVLFAAACQNKSDNYTVILSLDGNRWDYPDYYEMPFFDSLATVGVKARMEPSFPSSTFPNHYTMATGLVPDHNGLVNNSYWNPETQHGYAIRDPESRYDPRYYLGEPIWVTAQKQGVKCASIYWVGSDIPIKDTYPTYYRRWDDEPHWTFSERCDEIVRLMSLPEKERPRLVMGYFDEPDHMGHVFGPMSPETKEMCEEMDGLVHNLYLRLMALPYADKINFIVAGDHGMTPISKDRAVCATDYISMDWVERFVGDTPTSIWVKEGYVDSVYNHLSGVEHIRVWKKGEVPEYLNYGTSNRLGEIIVCPDLGWQFGLRGARNGGNHGFDCKEPDMMVAFRAIGPDFKVNYDAPYTEGEQSSFRNIDLYPLLCHLLGIKPAPVDGKLERIQKILK